MDVTQQNTYHAVHTALDSHQKDCKLTLDSAYIGVILIGITHGLNPSHGWPVAFLYSTLKNRPMLYGLVSSIIISFFHFISSIAVVLAYTLLTSFIDVSAQLLKYASAVMLLILAYLFYREDVRDELEAQHEHLHENLSEIEHAHEHSHINSVVHSHKHKHSKSLVFSLGGIAVFAFVLGFAHEEEFALLALAVGGIDPYILMSAYAASVTVALVGVTLICLRAYKTFLPKMRKYQIYLPKIGALALIVMAVAFMIGLA